MSDHNNLPDPEAAALIAQLQQNLANHQEQKAALEEEISAFNLVSEMPLPQDSSVSESDKQAILDMLNAVEQGEFGGVKRLK